LRIKEFLMGKGDRKTLRGKTYRGSYGNSRPHAARPAVAGAKATVTKPAAKKAATRKKSA
jgi:30S ribosomal protein S31